MLTGKELAKAIAAAIEKKSALDGSTQADVARHFGVKPSSVTGWVQDGRISKSRINSLVEYFSGVVGPEHFGLPPSAGDGNQPQNLSDDEKYLLKQFRKIKNDDQRAQLIEMASTLGRGAEIALQRQPTQADLNQLLQQSFADTDLAAYFGSTSEEARREIQIEIGGRVIKMLDRRQRDALPPGQKNRRAEGKQ